MSVALQRLWIQLTADRKRFGLLCAAMSIGLLLWARIIIISNVPRTAVAEDEAASVSGSASSTAPGVRSSHASSRHSAGTARVLGRSVVLETTPVRDPFVISARHFPKPEQDAPIVTEQSKSGLQSAEDAEQAKARQLAGLLTLISRFRLEAVMSDESGTQDAIAVISGRTWKRGDRIPAIGHEEIQFTLVQVRHRSVVLRFEDHIFELQMPKPGG